MPSSYDQYRTLFTELDAFLDHWKHLWQLSSFEFTEIPWRDRMPDLVERLSHCSLDEIQSYDRAPDRLYDLLIPFIPDLRHILSVSAFAPFPDSHTPFNRLLMKHIPYRKWEQITAFTGCLPFGDSTIIEWCAGKGHLGRLIAGTFSVSVESIERDSGLCRDGRLLATRAGVEMTFHQLDVCEEAVRNHIIPDVHPVALHACGQLHERLITLGAEQDCGRLSIAPCCYHKIPEDRYTPLSEAGKNGMLALDRFDLKLPQQEAVTGSHRMSRLRDVEKTWRLGFDRLRREITGEDRYVPVPSVRSSVLNTDFETFCRWAAGRLEVDIPSDSRFDRYESLGIELRPTISRIELVRHLFRAPLECWLLLDRTLFLCEKGYRVTVGPFCDKMLTPRNTLIHAELEG